jgi:hypothetical protein
MAQKAAICLLACLVIAIGVPTPLARAGEAQTSSAASTSAGAANATPTAKTVTVLPFRGKVVSKSAIKLYWSTFSDVNAERIYYKAPGKKTYSLLKTLKGKKAAKGSWMHKGLMTGHSYRYQLYACHTTSGGGYKLVRKSLKITIYLGIKDATRIPNFCIYIEYQIADGANHIKAVTMGRGAYATLSWQVAHKIGKKTSYSWHYGRKGNGMRLVSSDPQLVRVKDSGSLVLKATNATGTCIVYMVAESGLTRSVQIIVGDYTTGVSFNNVSTIAYKDVSDYISANATQLEQAAYLLQKHQFTALKLAQGKLKINTGVLDSSEEKIAKKESHFTDTQKALLTNLLSSGELTGIDETSRGEIDFYFKSAGTIETEDDAVDVTPCLTYAPCNCVGVGSGTIKPADYQVLPLATNWLYLVWWD